MTGTRLAVRGGWWHEYVCPVHHVELLAPDQDRHPCRFGCELVGEPWTSAWRALAHQRGARRLRTLAARAAGGDREAAEQALHRLSDYAQAYHHVGSDPPTAKEWMVPGRLFAQALSEAIWAAGIANAVWTLGAALDPAGQPRLTDAATPLLRGLHDTAVAARTRADLPSNYVAWFNAAGALTSGALARLGTPLPDQGWIDGPAGLYAHVRAAVLDDGWEWEGSTYYHAFVLLAYLYTLRGTDPTDLPPDVAERLDGMVQVLGHLAAPDGTLPALHDSPYRTSREHVVSEHQRTEVSELAELVALAPRLVATDALDPVRSWCRRILDGSGEKETPPAPGDWFAGPPLPARGTTGGSTAFRDAGYAVLRPTGGAAWQAVLDFGPHGGSHGHLDKLALYLYGDGVAWQPDPGVVPYGSRLRDDVYRTTRAHPTFSVDGAEQAECAGRLLRFEVSGAGTVVVAGADDAYPGVRARRHLVLLADGLLDVMHLRADRERALALHLRPAVPVTVRADGDAWRSDWGDNAPLAARHTCSAPAHLGLVPGWSTADDPTGPARWLDWTARTTDALFATLWLPGHPPDRPLPAALEMTPEALVVHRRGDTSTRYPLRPGG